MKSAKMNVKAFNTRCAAQGCRGHGQKPRVDLTAQREEQNTPPSVILKQMIGQSQIEDKHTRLDVLVGMAFTTLLI